MYKQSNVEAPLTEVSQLTYAFFAFMAFIAFMAFFGAAAAAFAAFLAILLDTGVVGTVRECGCHSRLASSVLNQRSMKEAELINSKSYSYQ